MNTQHLNGNSILENNQIESLLVEQDNKLQAIIEILQIILVNLNDQSDNQENQEQILMIKQALLNIHSNNKQDSTSHKESQKNTEQSLDAIKKENQNLRAYCQQIKQQLKKQDGVLEEHFSIKYTAIQYCSIALLAAVATVIGINLFLPAIDSLLPSRNGSELQKSSSEKPVKTPRKSK
jgi:predicted metal-dependent hydrolase